MPGEAGFWWWLLDRALSILGFVAAATATWLLNQYRKDRAMLLRHEETVDGHEKSLGLLLAAHNETDGGKKSIRIVTELENHLDALSEDMLEVKECQGILVQRMAEMNADQKVAGNNIEWIKKHLEK